MTSVGEQVKILVELQRIDSEIYQLRAQEAAIPVEQKRIEGEFEKKKAGLKAAEEALKHTQLKQKEKEGDLASKEEKIKKLQAQLYSLKTNKEYTAMEMEIKGIKADNSLLEEDILRLLDAVEQSKAQCAKEKQALAGEEKASKDSIEVLKKKAAELAAAIAALDEKRKTYTPNVDPKLLSQYEKVLKGSKGLGIAPVKNGTCGGCHIGLPPQMVNEVQIGEKLIACEDCARILYWVG